ncbi:hypothetical protein BSKO_00606 [Bryopsis sp. KO-2023]|nr:hypothetical protein BSKO_00606 [Bryopsis sp. KO-2023]
MYRHSLACFQECTRAQAPAALQRDILRQAFWKVDPHRVGDVSLQQFLQVWQNILELFEYKEAPGANRPRSKKALQPWKRRIVDRNAAAAVFVKFGFDRDGLMPYVVFINALTETPARLLGHELILDNAERGRNGLFDEVDVAMCVGDAKILYPKVTKAPFYMKAISLVSFLKHGVYVQSKSGVFPASGFDPRIAVRSAMLPKAHMWLEHVYGYAGIRNLSNNLFYTHNSTETISEVVYFTGMTGIVYCKNDHDEGKPSQRFFFGHDNDIECLAIHPSRRFVATGQQRAPGGLPYVCIWDVDTCDQLQRLDHCADDRSVIACCFSGNINATTEKGMGGDLLVTVTGDNKHTIHIWRWMTDDNEYVKATCIPGWFYGPDKKLGDLEAQGLFYGSKRRFGSKSDGAAQDSHPSSDHPVVGHILGSNAEPRAAAGFHTRHKPMVEDATWELLDEFPGFNGTPPVVYGVSWNPFRPHDGRKGSEFLSYGVKHMKTWIVSDQGQWIGSSATFGPTKSAFQVQNILSAIYVPAIHDRAAPGDSGILTGFADGKIGLWLPPYPTRPGSTYQLKKRFNGHEPGPLVTLNDGTQVHGGVRVLKLRANRRTVLSGGADGCVCSWQLEKINEQAEDGAPKRGVKLMSLFEDGEETGPNRFKLVQPSAPLEKESVPMLRGLDSHPLKPVEFIAGTDGCDIWEVDKDPRVLIEGNQADVYCCAAHPHEANVFATASECNRVILWDAKKREMLRSASMGFVCRSIAFSEEEFPGRCWNPSGGQGYHMAVGSKRGRLAILDGDTLQPLIQIHDSKECISEIKYSPVKGPGILAVGSNDLKIYLYNVRKGYQFIARCIGHSGTVEHIDWSLPIEDPLELKGKMILQSNDTSREILFWDPQTGKQITANQRDASWNTWTCTLGFDVMGIWPDFSDGTDVNAVCRSHQGKPVYNRKMQQVRISSGDECMDDVPGCGALVTADDFSFVKLFNYPVVADDAPFRCYRGHSSHVMSIRFLADDRTVVSVGGFDRAIFQWRTCGVNSEDAAEDESVLDGMQWAVKRRQEEKASLIPKPLSQWGALDGTGKNFGPIDDIGKSLKRMRSRTVTLTSQMSRASSGGLRQSISRRSSRNFSS